MIGRGFIPGITPAEGTAASAPEVCFSGTAFDFYPFPQPIHPRHPRRILPTNKSAQQSRAPTTPPRYQAQSRPTPIFRSPADIPGAIECGICTDNKKLQLILLGSRACIGGKILAKSNLLLSILNYHCQHRHCSPRGPQVTSVLGGPQLRTELLPNKCR